MLPEGLPYKIGRYELLSQIGQGVTSVVYKAQDTKLGRFVALKMLKSIDNADRFEREARISATLEHENISKIYDVGYENSIHYLTMNLVEGTPLNILMKKRQFSCKDSALLCKTLLLALDYAHSKGVIHRDLKPANIIVNNGNNPIITDFGLAKDMRSLSQTASGELIGTPLYMSPEQITGTPNKIDIRSDIYSVGAILYELLTGNPPFSGDTFIELSTKILNGAPVRLTKLNPKVSLDLETICLKALTREKSKRYQSAKDFADDLERYLSGEAILAKPPAISLRMLDLIRRNKGKVVAIGALTFVIIFSFAYSRIVTANRVNSYIRDGQSLITKGKYELAIEKFDNALGISPHEKLAISGKALCYLHRAQEACELQNYGLAEGLLKLAKELDKTLQDRINLLEKEVIGLAKLKIMTNPQGAEVIISGEEKVLGKTPLYNIDTKPGYYTLSFRLGGYLDFSMPIFIERKEQKVISIKLFKEGEIKEGMVYVPAGEYFSGDPSISLVKTYLKPFFIDRFEVTCSQYKKFIDATGHRAPFGWRNRTIPKGKENHPVTSISFEDASAYAQWAGKRLPTAEEWEKSARGTDARIFPWGKNYDTSRLNCGKTMGKQRTKEIGSFPAGISPYGCYDMAGNVWEWTSGSPAGKEDFRIICGGGWSNELRECTTYNQKSEKIKTRSASIGFRCVLDAQE
jgi:serine/threonine protein kinase